MRNKPQQLHAMCHGLPRRDWPTGSVRYECAFRDSGRAGESARRKGIQTPYGREKTSTRGRRDDVHSCSGAMSSIRADIRLGFQSSCAHRRRNKLNVIRKLRAINAAERALANGKCACACVDAAAMIALLRYRCFNDRLLIAD